MTRGRDSVPTLCLGVLPCWVWQTDICLSVVRSGLADPDNTTVHLVNRVVRTKNLKIYIAWSTFVQFNTFCGSWVTVLEASGRGIFSSCIKTSSSSDVIISVCIFHNDSKIQQNSRASTEARKQSQRQLVITEWEKRKKCLFNFAAVLL